MIRCFSHQLKHFIFLNMKFIFIGDIVPNNIMSLLNKIQDQTLYETWSKLDKNNYQKLEKYYGNKWYTKFFNTLHINSIIQRIRKNKQQQNTC